MNEEIIIRHDPEDVAAAAKQLSRELKQSLGFEHRVSTAIMWLDIIRKKPDRWRPTPNPDDPNQLCIRVYLAKALTGGVAVPTEFKGEKGTYKVFSQVTGPETLV